MFTTTQSQAVETLLKFPKIGCSEIARRSNLVSNENNHTGFLTPELEILQHLGILKGTKGKDKRYKYWVVVNPSQVRKDLKLRKRDKFINFMIKNI